MHHKKIQKQRVSISNKDALTKQMKHVYQDLWTIWLKYLNYSIFYSQTNSDYSHHKLFNCICNEYSFTLSSCQWNTYPKKKKMVLANEMFITDWLINFQIQQFQQWENTNLPIFQLKWEKPKRYIYDLYRKVHWRGLLQYTISGSLSTH